MGSSSKFYLIFFLAFITSTLLAQRPSGTRSGRPGGPPKVKVVGQIIDDATQAPMEFATISIFSKKDSTLKAGGLTDIDGKFEIISSPVPSYAVLEFISYEKQIIDPIPFERGKPMVNLGQIIMVAEGLALDEVQITAERSETTFSLDKKVFTVGKDLANRGGSAEDILDNVPSVTVDIEGNVSLRGSSGVRMLIDGKPSSLAGVGNTNGLRNIPSNMIEKVEVITNPSARYEAEGMAGIINIVLKKDTGSGFNGAFDVSAGAPGRVGAGANVNYRKGNLNWFASYGLNYRENPGGGSNIQDQSLNTSTGELLRQLSLQDRDQNRTGLSNSLRFGADYFFNDKEQLTAALTWRVSDEDNFSDVLFEDYRGTDSEIGFSPLWNESIDYLKGTDLDDVNAMLNQSSFFGRTFRTDDEAEDERNLEYNLNYRKEFSSRDHNFSATVQFRDKSETENSLFDQETFDGTQSLVESLDQRSTNEEGEQTWLFQMDYVHPLGKDHKFEIGARSQLRDIRNDFLVEEFQNDEWFSLRGLSNNFLYDENIHAIYAIYGNAFGNFSFQGGLRAEYSDIVTQLLATEQGGLNDRDYSNLFPSGHLNYKLSEVNALQLSYSRRVRRPRFWDLNPFFTFTDNRNFFSGNPNIDPEFTDSYEFGQISYWDKFSLNTSIFYRTTDASIQRVLSVDNFEGTTLRVPLNIGTVDDLGLDISMSYSGLKWLRIDGNWNIFRNQLTVAQDQAFDAVYTYYQVVREFDGSESEFVDQYDFNLNETDNITWNGRLTARISFWDSDLQLRANYRGPRETSQGSTKAVGSFDVGWSRDFLGKNMTLTLSARDLFNSRRRNGLTLLDDFYQQSQFQWRARSVTLTASYRINQKKKRSRGGRGGGEFEGGGEF